jgi:hypothetical protein
MRPQTAKELWTLLMAIFPGFSADCEVCLDEELEPETYRDLQGAELDHAIVSEANRFVKEGTEFDPDDTYV